MNIFELMEHQRLGKAKPGYHGFRQGEVISHAGWMPGSLYLLRWGNVLGCRNGFSGTVHALHQVRDFRRTFEKEPTPIFGAADFFSSRPTETTFIAASKVEIMTIGSEHLIDLGRKGHALIIVRELIRDSDLSEELLMHLKGEYVRTGLPGFRSDNPRDILTRGADQHIDAYVEYSQKVLEMLVLRRAGLSGEKATVKMPELKHTSRMPELMRLPG